MIGKNIKSLRKTHDLTQDFMQVKENFYKNHLFHSIFPKSL